MKYLKNTLCIFLAAVIAFTALGISALAADSVLPENASYFSGDADGNGIVNSADSLVILNHSIGESKITDVVRLEAADVSNDGRLNSTDALYILNFKVGNIDKFPRDDFNLIKIAGNMYLDSYTGCVIDAKGVGLVGYAYDTNAGVFYATGEGFQREFGYDELYDTVAVVGTMPLDTTRIKFSYAGMDWMVQLWKGYYGYVFAGCEVGLYNRPGGSTGTAYNVVTLEYYVDFTVNFYFASTTKPTFTRSTKTWWFTAFTPSIQVLPETNIPKMKMDCTMKFSDIGLYRAFVDALSTTTTIYANYTGKSRTYCFTQGTNYQIIGNDTVRFQWQ